MNPLSVKPLSKTNLRNRKCKKNYPRLSNNNVACSRGKMVPAQPRKVSGDLVFQSGDIRRKPVPLIVRRGKHMFPFDAHEKMKYVSSAQAQATTSSPDTRVVASMRVDCTTELSSLSATHLISNLSGSRREPLNVTYWNCYNMDIHGLEHVHECAEEVGTLFNFIGYAWVYEPTGCMHLRSCLLPKYG